MADEHRVLMFIPDSVSGPRVVARRFSEADAQSLHDAVQESLDHLRPWLPWWNSHQSVDDTRAFLRRNEASWLLREAFNMGVFSRENGAFLGGIGLHPLDWTIPSFEIGYWLRHSAEGHGYMSEATRLITTSAFDTLRAQRVVIRCDARNTRSKAVPERLGYVLEGHLRHFGRDTSDKIADELIYAMIPTDYHATGWHTPPALS